MCLDIHLPNHDQLTTHHKCQTFFGWVAPLTFSSIMLTSFGLTKYSGNSDMQKSTMENTCVEQKGSWPVIGSAMSLLDVMSCHATKTSSAMTTNQFCRLAISLIKHCYNTKDVTISLQWGLHVILTKHHLSKICYFHLKLNTKIRQSELTKCQDCCCWDPPPPQQCASGFAQLVWPEPFQGLMKDRPVGLDKFKFHRNVVVVVVVVV